MGRKAFQAIAEGLEDAIAFTRGEKARGHVHRVRARDVDVVATRERLGLSQAEFATAFGSASARSATGSRAGGRQRARHWCFSP